MKRTLLLLTIAAVSLTSKVRAQITYLTDTTNIVYVSYTASAVSISMATNIKDYVTVSTNGTDVTITQSASVSDATGEIVYALSGSCNDGSFTLDGSYKCTVELFGLTLTNPTGPAINILNKKRVELSSKKETVSTLTDGKSTAADAWKGALQCKGHLEFKGKGTVNIYGNYAHGIWAKEYIEVKNCTINILSAVKDAINCNQYFLMESGMVNLSGFADDGIQVSLKTDDTSAENTGNFSLSGGTINIDMTEASGESVKAEGVATVAAAAKLNITGTGSAVENITLNDSNNAIDVYSPIGTHIGTFQSVGHATQQLPCGIYILSNGKKIVL